MSGVPASSHGGVPTATGAQTYTGTAAANYLTSTSTTRIPLEVDAPQNNTVDVAFFGTFNGGQLSIGQNADTLIQTDVAGTYAAFAVRNSGGNPVLQARNEGGIATRGEVLSGALSTTTFVSGTGKQIGATQDRELLVPVTFNPTAGAAATCVIALSPDDATYSTLGTETEPAGIALDGTIHVLRILVPAAWFVKLTATNAVIGTGTYY